MHRVPGNNDRKKHWTVSQRQLIIDLWNQGKRYKEVQQMAGMAKSTIQNILKKYRTHGTVTDLPGRGSERKTSSRIDNHVEVLVNKNPFLSAPVIAKEIQDVYNVQVTPQTIRNRIREKGFRGRAPVKKPFLTKKHMERRLEFTKKYHKMPLSFWKKVLWTDESKFNMFKSDGMQKVWRKPGQSYKLSCLRGTVKFGGGNIMLWGSMAWNGTGKLAFIDDKMDAQLYVDILKKNLLASTRKLRLGRQFIMQQDNDPKHTSKKAKEYFTQNNIEVLEWPAQSPDLNPIEHLWAVLDRKAGPRSLRKKEDLKELIESSWNEIEPAVTKKLVESMPNRLLEVMKAKGGPTRY